jgi:SAM-dependent methyltransferase
VDISDTGIEFGRRLSEESGIPATFHRSDVYDWLDEAASRGEQYDIVFSSYGFLVWLSDVETWARGVAAILKPGGRFVMMEFHPFANTFDWDWTHKSAYFAEGKELTWDEGIGDYVALAGPFLAPSGYLEGVKDFRNPHQAHEFQWGIGEVATALLDAGLLITTLREYPYSNGAKLFDRMREMPDKRVYPPEDVPNLPLMYALAAQKGL